MNNEKYMEHHPFFGGSLNYQFFWGNQRMKKAKCGVNLRGFHRKIARWFGLVSLNDFSKRCCVLWWNSSTNEQISPQHKDILQHYLAKVFLGVLFLCCNGWRYSRWKHWKFRWQDNRQTSWSFLLGLFDLYIIYIYIYNQYSRTAIVVTPPCTEGKHDWILNQPLPQTRLPWP